MNDDKIVVRHSLYWDDFARRIPETITAINYDQELPIRRVAVFITDRCNFKCAYCNHTRSRRTLSQALFHRVISDYGSTAIIHITGGEPSMVPWLYPLIKATGELYRYTLNTNAFIMPPATSIRRLKVSLDSTDDSWDALVCRTGAFRTVVDNIKVASRQTVTTVTCTLTKENYPQAVEMARFVRSEFPDLYALFFSVYKGKNPRFVMQEADVNMWFSEVLPHLKPELSTESLALLEETIDEPRRLLRGTRFPENVAPANCYISMSERVISPDGNEYACSHLYRDGIYTNRAEKRSECLYGCNRRLVQFNQEVAKGLLR